MCHPHVSINTMNTEERILLHSQTNSQERDPHICVPLLAGAQPTTYWRLKYSSRENVNISEWKLGCFIVIAVQNVIPILRRSSKINFAYGYSYCIFCLLYLVYIHDQIYLTCEWSRLSFLGVYHSILFNRTQPCYPQVKNSEKMPPISNISSI